MDESPKSNDSVESKVIYELVMERFGPTISKWRQCIRKNLDRLRMPWENRISREISSSSSSLDDLSSDEGRNSTYLASNHFSSHEILPSSSGYCEDMTSSDSSISQGTLKSKIRRKRVSRRTSKIVQFAPSSSEELLSQTEECYTEVIYENRNHSTVRECYTVNKYIPKNVKLGIISLSNIKIKGLTSENGENYFCEINNGDEKFSTMLAEVDQNGNAIFLEEFRFPSMPADFELTVEVKSSRINWAKAPRDFCGCFCSPKPKRRTQLTSPIVTSLSKFIITIDHVDRSGNSRLLSLQDDVCSIEIKISTRSCANLSNSGFLQVGQRKNQFVFWKYTWCFLSDGILEYWSDPANAVFNRPECSINLAKCIRVRIPAKDEYLKRWTFVLECPNEPDHYFAADNEKDFYFWRDCLQSIIEGIRTWGKLELQSEI